MSARVFYLDRAADPSGVSGTGRVAEGCVFSDGTVVLRWRSVTASTVVYGTLSDVEAVHGHGGTTAIVWEA